MTDTDHDQAECSYPWCVAHRLCGCLDSYRQLHTGAACQRAAVMRDDGTPETPDAA